MYTHTHSYMYTSTCIRSYECVHPHELILTSKCQQNRTPTPGPPTKELPLWASTLGHWSWLWRETLIGFDPSHNYWCVAVKNHQTSQFGESNLYPTYTWCVYIYIHMCDSAGCLAGHVFRLVSPPKFMGTCSVSTGLIYNLLIFLLTFWQLNHIFTPGFCRFNPHIFGELPWVVPVSGRGWTPACSSARLCSGTTAAGGARWDEASAEFSDSLSDLSFMSWGEKGTMITNHQARWSFK